MGVPEKSVREFVSSLASVAAASLATNDDKMDAVSVSCTLDVMTVCRAASAVSSKNMAQGTVAFVSE